MTWFWFRFTLQIEVVSCDEMYADVSELLDLREKPGGAIEMINPIILGEVLRREIFVDTECRATCGFGTNRLLARMATKRAKPNGEAFFIGGDWRLVLEAPGKLYQLASDEGMAYFNKLLLSDLPGVGTHTLSRVSEQFGVSTCGELVRLVTPAQLSSVLGAKTGQRLLNLCQGKDTNEITIDRSAKSISAEITYGIRLASVSFDPGRLCFLSQTRVKHRKTFFYVWLRLNSIY